MSAPIVAFLRKVLENIDPALTAEATEVAQYNIRTDGEVSATYVFRPSERKIDEEAVEDATITITIDEEDFVALYKSDGQLVALNADGKIEVSGEESMLEKIDEGRVQLLLKLKELMDAQTDE